MRSWLAGAVAVLLWAGTARAATDLSGEVVIQTRDGKTRVGRVLSETEKGYLLKSAAGTEVIAFDQIEDLKRVALAPPPPPPPVAAETRAAPYEDDDLPRAPERDWLSERKGFHLGIGAGAFAYPTGGYPSVVGFMTALLPLNFGFGRVDLRVTPQLLGLFSATGAGAFAGVDVQLRINFTRLYTLGVGSFQTLLFGYNSVFLLWGPTIAPVVLKLGERGQHELSLWLTLPIPLNASYGYTFLPLATLGYTYMF